MAEMSGNGVPATAAVLKQQAAQMQEVFHALQVAPRGVVLDRQQE